MFGFNKIKQAQQKTKEDKDLDRFSDTSRTTLSPTETIAREKQLKNWRRDKKVALINRINPEWEDLVGVVTG